MVLGQILKIGSFVVRHRKTIYRVLSAQDRYIDRSMKAGRYGKAARYGVRHGALVGSLTGSLLAPDTPGNDDAFQKTNGQQPKTGTPHKTRYRRTTRRSTSRTKEQYFDNRKRCPRPRKYY